MGVEFQKIIDRLIDIVISTMNSEQLSYILLLLSLLCFLMLFGIVYKTIKWYLRLQSLRATSRPYAAARLAFFLFLGLLAFTSPWSLLFQQLAAGVAQLFHLQPYQVQQQERYNLLLYFIFVSGTVLLTALQDRNRTTNQDKTDPKADDDAVDRSEATVDDIGSTAKKYPHLAPGRPVSPHVHERVKKLFELAYACAGFLTYDRTQNVLFGTYGTGLHHHNLVAYIHPTATPQVVDHNDLRIARERISHALTSRWSSYHDDGLSECYYVLESGSFAPPVDTTAHRPPIKCLTEKQLAKSLVRIDRYLDSIVMKYKEDRLPFSPDTDKNTLATTYIAPTFNGGQSDLAGYLDRWLEEGTPRQIVIVADYGMGKTSFMKYYAMRLADRILKGEDDLRVPIFLELTNTSPMHGGVEGLVKTFVADELGISFDLFLQMEDRGRVVFLLDGFDEMGFIGSHKVRVRQVEHVFRLVTQNAHNKLIISGRGSFFLTDPIMNDCFYIWQDDGVLPPPDRVYCSKIQLDSFSDGQIGKSLVAYYPDSEERERYFWYIKNTASIRELCGRPSMLHIVRQMLPLLTAEHADRLSSADLMEKYCWHWIERQQSKEIVSEVVDTHEKKIVLYKFFVEVAGRHYQSGEGNLAVEPGTLARELGPTIRRFQLENQSQREGWVAEVLTGYFLERIGGIYKFVHKSFFEYFVARKIVTSARGGNTSDRLFSTEWAAEISEFVHEIAKSEGFGRTDRPTLLEMSPDKVTRRVALEVIELVSWMSSYGGLSVGGLVLGVLVISGSVYSTGFWVALMGGGVMGVRRRWKSRGEVRQEGEHFEEFAAALVVLSRALRSGARGRIVPALARIGTGVMLGFGAVISSATAINAVLVPGNSFIGGVVYSASYFWEGIWGWVLGPVLGLGIVGIVCFVLGFIGGDYVERKTPLNFLAKALAFGVSFEGWRPRHALGALRLIRWCSEENLRLDGWNLRRQFGRIGVERCIIRGGSLRGAVVECRGCHLFGAKLLGLAYRIGFKSCVLQEVDFEHVRPVGGRFFRLELSGMGIDDLDDESIASIVLMLRNHDLRVERNVVGGRELMHRLRYVMQIAA